jgi:hypothetical protein
MSSTVVTALQAACHNLNLVGGDSFQSALRYVVAFTGRSGSVLISSYTALHAYAQRFMQVSGDAAWLLCMLAAVSFEFMRLCTGD